MKLQPRIDGEFFPNDFPNILINLKLEKKPGLLGITACEMIYYSNIY